MSPASRRAPALSGLRSEELATSDEGRQGLKGAWRREGRHSERGDTVSEPNGAAGPPSGLVSVEQILDAARRLDGVAVRTPLIPLPRLDPPLLVKPESLQPTGSFKVRGAYAAITAREQAARQHGVVAHS